MNLKDKRTKRLCAASASAAIIVGGGVVVATGASAAGAFALAPNVSSITTLDLGAKIAGGHLDQDLADATFGFRANATIQGDYKLVLDSFTPAGTNNEYQPGSSFVVAGAGGSVVPALDIAQMDAGGLTGPGGTGAGAPAWSAVSLNDGTGNPAQGVSTNLVATKETYVTANAPGTYKFHFLDTGLSGGDSDDAVSSTVTATVLDSEDVTSATSDDWTPAVSGTNGSVDIGAPLSVSVSLPSVTQTDVRSTNSGVGVLLSKLASLVGIKFTSTANALHPAGGTDYTAYATGELHGSTVTRTVPVGVADNAGTVDGTAAFDTTGSGTWATPKILGTTSATLTNNDVTAVNLALTADQDDNVSTSGSPRLVRKGTATVRLESRATLAGSASGARTVYYTFSNFVGGLTASDLTVNGQPLPASGSVAVTTDATTNIAALNVTSAKTDSGYGYTVSTSSNGHAASSSIALQYAAAAATAIKSSGSYSQTVGGSVTISGAVLDQWGKLFSPAAGTQATLTVKQNTTGDVTGTPDYSRTVDVVDGKFSATYSDIAGNSTPRTDAYSWTVGSGSSAVSSTLPNDHILWLRSVAAGSATLTSLDGVTSFPFGSNTPPFSVATHATTNSVVLKGTLKDNSGSALPYVNFALTATPGVYFIDADGKAQTTLTGRTTSTGALSADGTTDGVTVFFTKAGTDTNIKLMAGDIKVETGAFTVQQAAGPNAGDDYNVTANDVTTEAGAYTILSGNVTDAFGNPVANADVTVTVDKDATGVITSSAIRTDANGRWTAVYLAGVNDPSPNYTATIADGPYKAADYLNTGLKLSAGVASATGTITVTVDKITVSAPTRVSAGYVTISGEAKPGTKVAVFAMTGGRHQVGSAVADADTGTWSVRVYVSRNTAFQAETSTAVSNAVVVHVKSAVKLSVKRYKSGVAKVTVTGGPSKSGTVTLYATHGIKHGKVAFHVSSTKTLYVKAGKGYTTFTALFTSTGSDTSSKVSVRVKL